MRDDVVFLAYVEAPSPRHPVVEAFEHGGDERLARQRRAAVLAVTLAPEPALESIPERPNIGEGGLHLVAETALDAEARRVLCGRPAGHHLVDEVWREEPTFNGERLIGH